MLSLQLSPEAVASRKIALEVQTVVNPARAAAVAAAQQALQSVAAGQELEQLRSTWAALQPTGMADPATAAAAAEGMQPTAIRSVLQGWEAAGEEGKGLAGVLDQLLSREGWELGWAQPRFFRKDVQMGGRKVAAGQLSYQCILEGKAALQGLINTQTGKLQLPGSEEQYCIRYNELPVRVFSLAGVRGVEPQHWAQAVEAAGVTVLAAAWALDRQQRPCRDVVKLVLAVTGFAPTAVEMAPVGGESFFVQLRECTDEADLGPEAFRKAAMTGLAREWVGSRRQQQLEEEQQRQRQQREQRERERQQQAAEAAARQDQRRQEQRQQQQERRRRAQEEATQQRANQKQGEAAAGPTEAQQQQQQQGEGEVAAAESAQQQQQQQLQGETAAAPQPQPQPVTQPAVGAAASSSSSSSGANGSDSQRSAPKGSNRRTRARQPPRQQPAPREAAAAGGAGAHKRAAAPAAAATDAHGQELKRQRLEQFKVIKGQQQQQQQRRLKNLRGKQQHGSGTPLPSIIPADFSGTQRATAPAAEGGSPQEWPAAPWASSQQ